jgi:hypothetical protein
VIPAWIPTTPPFPRYGGSLDRQYAAPSGDRQVAARRRTSLRGPAATFFVGFGRPAGSGYDARWLSLKTYRRSQFFVLRFSLMFMRTTSLPAPQSTRAAGPAVATLMKSTPEPPMI